MFESSIQLARIDELLACNEHISSIDCYRKQQTTPNDEDDDDSRYCSSASSTSSSSPSTTSRSTSTLTSSPSSSSSVDSMLSRESASSIILRSPISFTSSSFSTSSSSSSSSSSPSPCKRRLISSHSKKQIVLVGQQQQQTQPEELADDQQVAHQVTSQSDDPVFLLDEKVFLNLILKESYEMEQRQFWLSSRKVDDDDDEDNNNHHQRQQHMQFSLCGHLRRLILSWMLDICQYKQFQDDIFPHATLLLDKFLMIKPDCLVEASSGSQQPEDGVHVDEREELLHRQLYQYAASALLVATKMRQTRFNNKNFVDELAEFSLARLQPFGLASEEIRQAELLMLFTLNWDYSLVAPNDFLPILVRRCGKLICSTSLTATTTTTSLGEGEKTTRRTDINQKMRTNKPTTTTTTTTTKLSNASNYKPRQAAKAVATTDNNHSNHHHNDNHRQAHKRTREIINSDSRQEDVQGEAVTKQFEANTLERAQQLLDICLMDFRLSQYSPSILAMASLAVAIDGLSEMEKTCWHLNDIIAKIHDSTHKVNELEQMIEVAFQIEKLVIVQNNMYRKRRMQRDI